MSERDAFLAAIAANPDDATARGAFADWLDEHGEPDEAKKYREPRRGSWVVRMKVERIVEVVCENCTEEEARKDPHDFIVGEETEIEQYDYDVVSVEPNE